MASINERLDSVGLYTDALEAVKQLKGLAELKQSITSFNKENEGSLRCMYCITSYHIY